MKDLKDDYNTIVTCLDCSKKMYPNAGKYTQKQLQRAKSVKTMFSEEGKMPEHMWVKVSKLVTLGGVTNICGVLDNEPVNLEKIKMGDNVMVSSSMVETIKTTEDEEEKITCELCEDDFPIFVDTGMSEYFLCPDHLINLLLFSLKTEEAKNLIQTHGQEDFYLDKEFYDKDGHILKS